MWSETQEVTLPTDPPLSFRVRHIGTLDDPAAYDRIQTRWQATLKRLRIKTRKQLLAEYATAESAVAALGSEADDTFEKVVSAELFLCDDFTNAFAEKQKALVLAGCVDGEALYKTLFEAAGPGAVILAAAKVIDFQSVSAPQGNV